jgi:hypothetical protein
MSDLEKNTEGFIPPTAFFKTAIPEFYSDEAVRHFF